MLSRQTVEAPKGFNSSSVTNLAVQRPNKKFLWLNINLLVWMYHTGEKRYEKRARQKFITKRARVVEEYDQLITNATSQRR